MSVYIMQDGTRSRPKWRDVFLHNYISECSIRWLATVWSGNMRASGYVYHSWYNISGMQLIIIMTAY